jgi:lauroyl/myristoyl acyltransferase
MAYNLKAQDLSRSYVQSLREWIEPRDLTILAELMVLSLVSWLIPQRYWLSISKGLADARQLSRRDCPARAARVAALLQGRTVPMQPQEIVRTVDAYYFLERLQLLRLYRPGGWNPVVRLEGAEHIERALDAGKGAILWIAPFSFYSQVTKMALAQAGYRVSHLSRLKHGFHTATWFGKQCLNPIRTRQEERYLDQRVVIGGDGSQPVLGRLEALLRQGRLVSITVGRQARRTCHVAFLNGQLELATGPAYLAHKTGAPLLPVFTVREPDGHFTIRIEPPLNDARSEDADGDIKEIVAEYALLFEQHVLDCPAQYLGGLTMI